MLWHGNLKKITNIIMSNNTFNLTENQNKFNINNNNNNTIKL